MTTEQKEKIVASIDWAVTHLTRAKLVLLGQPGHDFEGYLQAAQDNLNTIDDLLVEAGGRGLSHGLALEDPAEGHARGPGMGMEVVAPDA